MLNWIINPSVKGGLLKTITGVDLTSLGNTPLLTPTQKAIITGVIFIPTTAVAAVGDAIVNVGTNNPTFDNIIKLHTLTGLTAITKLYNIAPTNGIIHLVVAAEVITLKVTGIDSGNTLIVDVLLRGLLI